MQNSFTQHMQIPQSFLQTLKENENENFRYWTEDPSLSTSRHKACL
jgi:hypothetical protein